MTISWKMFAIVITSTNWNDCSRLVEAVNDFYHRHSSIIYSKTPLCKINQFRSTGKYGVL